MSSTVYFDFENMPYVLSSAYKRYALIKISESFILSLSEIFYFLYLIDLLGYFNTSLIVSIIFFTQTMSDFPSGVLGDLIGQKKVLTIAYVLYGCTFFLFLRATDLWSFVLLGILFGLARAQQSGSLQTWIDNIYSEYVQDNDPERKKYGFNMARIEYLDWLSLAVSFLVGGFIATQDSRKVVFKIQIISIVFLIILVIKLLKIPSTHTEFENQNTTNPKKGYTHYFSSSLKFLFSTKERFFILLGLVIWRVYIIIWGTLILLPIYYGYSGSDKLSGIIRTIVYVNGIIIGIAISKFSLKLKNKDISRLMLIHSISFFSSIFLLLTFIHVNNTFNPIGFGITILIYAVCNGVILGLIFILIPRVQINIIPSENRHGIYSLIPSLVSLIAVIILPITGKLIQENNDLRFGVIICFVLTIMGLVLTINGFKYTNKSPNN